MSEPRVTREPSFLADWMLGKLARGLRILGYDAAYARVDDAELVAMAAAEGRILLTRDRRLVERRECASYLLIESDDPREQLRRVLEELEVDPASRPALTRCLECNEALVEMSRNAACGKVPLFVHENHRRFAWCRDCGRIYWRGTHVDDMLQQIDRIDSGGS